MLDIVTQFGSGQVPAKERRALPAIDTVCGLPMNLRVLFEANKQLVKLQFARIHV